MIMARPSEYQLQAFELVPMYVTVFGSYVGPVTMIMYWLCLGRTIYIFSFIDRKLVHFLKRMFWSGFVWQPCRRIKRTL